MNYLIAASWKTVRSQKKIVYPPLSTRIFNKKVIHRDNYAQSFVEHTLRWSFPSSISSVNVTRSTGNYRRNP